MNNSIFSTNKAKHMIDAKKNLISSTIIYNNYII
jgi:hypothetical protein